MCVCTYVRMYVCMYVENLIMGTSSPSKEKARDLQILESTRGTLPRTRKGKPNNEVGEEYTRNIVAPRQVHS